MNQIYIFYPITALAFLTLMVLVFIPYRRFKAVLTGQISGEDFKYGESQNVPPEVRIPNRNLMNLFEIPILFYVGCFTLYLTKNVNLISVCLAWSYFTFRLCHSVIHLTYNKVFHRLVSYALSNFVIVAMWIFILYKLLKQNVQ